jgi:hypothetical protein
MKHQNNLRGRYIQLVETFITAIENGRSVSELDEIRTEIRAISSQFGLNLSVDNSTQVSVQTRSRDQGNETKIE